MTKVEYGKCEKLMNDAISKAILAQDEYYKSEKYLQVNGDKLKSEIELRKADQHYGEVIGINKVLTALGFDHDRMKRLGELL